MVVKEAGGGGSGLNSVGTTTQVVHSDADTSKKQKEDSVAGVPRLSNTISASHAWSFSFLTLFHAVFSFPWPDTSAFLPVGLGVSDHWIGDEHFHSELLKINLRLWQSW